MELLEEHGGIVVDLDTDMDMLVGLCTERGIPVEDHYGPGKLILELYEKLAEPELWGPVFVTDYPKEVSPLSRDHREHPGWVERFEGIVAGRELCNAFTELVDPDEQRPGSRPRRWGRRPVTLRPWSSTRTTCGRWSTAFPRPVGWGSAWTDS